MNSLTTIIIIYICILNIVGLAVMWLDKDKAKHNAWRIPEKKLFLISFIGGSIGTLVGMYVFRHKTKHWYFVVGMWLILVLHLYLMYCYYFK